MTAEMEDFGTFVAAKQLSSILAHSTPVLIGVLLNFGAFLGLLLFCWRWPLLLVLRLHACAIRKTSFGSRLDLTQQAQRCGESSNTLNLLDASHAQNKCCHIHHRYLQTELRHHPQAHPWWLWQALEMTFSFSLMWGLMAHSLEALNASRDQH